MIIVPSFFGINEGMDPRNEWDDSVFDFNFNKFDVFVVGEKLDVLSFGKLGEI